jgi:6-phosphogluconolactonase
MKIEDKMTPIHPRHSLIRLLASGLFCAFGVCAYLTIPPGSSAGASSAGQPKKAQSGAKSKKEKLLIYVGTYTDTTSKGIYILNMDKSTGELTLVGSMSGSPHPTFLALHPNHKFLYAVNEIGNYQGKKAGAVSAFAIAPGTGLLTALNQQSSGGDGPCHITVDSQGKNVLVANYGGGSVACLPIHADGTLGEATTFIQDEGSSANPNRQEGPHAHSMTLDAANRFAIAADLGIDKVLIYRFDASKGTLTPNDPAFASTAPGAGPRHFAFHPNGRYAYVINELNSTVTAFRYDSGKGSLSEIETLSTLPADFPGANNTTAEVLIHPSGKFLYGSNRGHNSIVIYRIDPATGKLTLIGHESTQGKTPRNFSLDPSGTFLLAANQDTNNIVVFRLDPKTGKLTPTGHSIEVPKPVCINMMSLPR